MREGGAKEGGAKEGGARREEGGGGREEGGGRSRLSLLIISIIMPVLKDKVTLRWGKRRGTRGGGGNDVNRC